MGNPGNVYFESVSLTGTLTRSARCPSAVLLDAARLPRQPAEPGRELRRGEDLCERSNSGSAVTTTRTIPTAVSANLRLDLLVRTLPSPRQRCTRNTKAASS